MTDYSEPLLAARKAIANAEALALHGNRLDAIAAAEMALVHVNRLIVALGQRGVEG